MKFSSQLFSYYGLQGVPGTSDSRKDGSVCHSGSEDVSGRIVGC